MNRNEFLGSDAGFAGAESRTAAAKTNPAPATMSWADAHKISPMARC